jgi:hypothetical protein
MAYEKQFACVEFVRKRLEEREIRNKVKEMKLILLD